VEAGRDGVRRELGPAVRRREIGVDHRLHGPHAVQAGALGEPQLGQLELPARVVGGGHEPQLAAVVGQHDAHGIGPAHQGRVLAQRRHEVDDVEVGDEGVGHVDEQI
jgi:hypothetical protein